MRELQDECWEHVMWSWKEFQSELRVSVGWLFGDFRANFKWIVKWILMSILGEFRVNFWVNLFLMIFLTKKKSPRNSPTELSTFYAIASCQPWELAKWNTDTPHHQKVLQSHCHDARNWGGLRGIEVRETRSVTRIEQPSLMVADCYCNDLLMCMYRHSCVLIGFSL